MVDSREIYTIRNLGTLKFLDANVAGSVYTGDGNGGNNQKWVLRRYGDAVSLNNLVTGGFLDSNEAGRIYCSPNNGGNYQRWKLSPSGF